MSTPYAVGCTNELLGGLLASYEFNLLDDSEKDQFEKHMSECAACSQEITSTKETWNWLRAHADIFDHPERYYQKRCAFFAAFSLKPTMAFAAAAAMMLFLAIGVGYFHRSNADPLAGLVAMEEDVSGARFRKGSEDLATGMKAFRAKDLERAKIKFEAVDPKAPDYYVAQYFLALCLMKPFEATGKMDRATLTETVQVLTRAAQGAAGRDPVYEGKAYLATAHAYWLAGERQPARVELGKVESLRGPEIEIGPLKKMAHTLREKFE